MYQLIIFLFPAEFSIPNSDQSASWDYSLEKILQYILVVHLQHEFQFYLYLNFTLLPII